MERVALITGGSRGIGLSFAEALLGAGYRVTITGARDRAQLQEAAERLGQAGRVLPVLADAGRAEDAERAVAKTLERFGRLDVLINNAGRGPREVSETFHQTPPKFWETAPEAWAEIVQSNVNGPFLMARAAALHMIAQGWGRIIGISTSRVTMVRQGFAPYGPTKAALDAMTRIFAQDLEGTGVTCNILLPGGATDTDFIPEGRSGAYLNLLPVDVMNEALLWLVSDAADGITAARFVGSRWDPRDISAAREDIGDPPLIL
ncbi:SDR family NAD(P)-dependent oxidoreductase [Thalassococcus sp. S3]|uniref:SDR family NAD(P)-dependent oxidoreductase n=1 Tax=Thalassococcus sp. S3 TaxID=2017482 RepID=UPI001024548C|nr:SDR family oxidoreductase [Thalassococcus sp. S3]QBF31997.1 short-chain dehydrogenase [Thalassococcus sp. S3]